VSYVDDGRNGVPSVYCNFVFLFVCPTVLTIYLGKMQPRSPLILLCDVSDTTRER
jgi:hypothetical protein